MLASSSMFRGFRATFAVLLNFLKGLSLFGGMGLYTGFSIRKGRCRGRPTTSRARNPAIRTWGRRGCSLGGNDPARKSASHLWSIRNRKSGWPGVVTIALRTWHRSGTSDSACRGPFWTAPTPCVQPASFGSIRGKQTGRSPGIVFAEGAPCQPRCPFVDPKTFSL